MNFENIVDCLKVATDAIKPQTAYRVDVDAGRLIETQARDHSER